MHGTRTDGALRHRDATFALTGARSAGHARRSTGRLVDAVRARAGSVLTVGLASGPGCRTYLAVRGGFDVPEYLGSCATFTLGGFGGHAGRALRAGDVVPLRAERTAPNQPEALPPELLPDLTDRWQIGVLPGPHAAPDYLTGTTSTLFYATEWQVHFNSARTGVRLIGPRLSWARPDGGEAGLHPSNINDTPYAVGAIDFTGDMPIILGPDGPSLGGFVCPATVAQAELWKVGQLARRRHRAVRRAERGRGAPRGARSGRPRSRRAILGAAPPMEPAVPRTIRGPVLLRLDEDDDRPTVTYRRSGERNLLIEYGPDVLDLDLRARVHSLAAWLASNDVDGVIDVTPGIRSLQVHFDTHETDIHRVLDVAVAAEAELPSIDAMQIPSRIVHLPLSWDDPSTLDATERYMLTVRDDAPWCPHNLEFIRRINGLESIDDVYTGRVRRELSGAGPG